jgi:hypothetical protein
VVFGDGDLGVADDLGVSSVIGPGSMPIRST